MLSSRLISISFSCLVYTGEDLIEKSSASESVIAMVTAPSTIPREVYDGNFLKPSGKFSFSHQSNSQNNNPVELHRQWTDTIVTWYEDYEKSQSYTNARGRKSRFKRPREVPAVPDLPLPPRKKTALEKALQQQSASVFSAPVAAAASSGVPAAQLEWRILVDLSAGQAVKRIRERKRKQSTPSIAKGGEPQPNEAVWRNLIRGERDTEQTQLTTGDFRKHKPEDLSSSSGSRVSMSASQQTWKAVLSCAKALENQLQKGPATPPLNILNFCQNASKLTPPESIWTYSDPMVKEINDVMDTLMKAVIQAKRLRAEWMDLWYQPGVDIDAVKKSLKRAENLYVRPDVYEELCRELEVVIEWQTQVDEMRKSPKSGQDDVTEMETLYQEAKSLHAFQSKGMRAVESRLEKAAQLTDKINKWKERIANGDPKESTKFLTSLVREINRLKLKFEAASFALSLSEDVESWIERANIAIRSRISLSEIKSLIERGQEIPVELSEYLEKLKSRVETAEDWLEKLQEFATVPSLITDDDALSWMKSVREKLNEDSNVAISMHDLACEGSRIPVEMDSVKLLQIELDARNWSVKAKKWIPDEVDSEMSRKGKIEEIREHVEKAESLRQRLSLSPEARNQWMLDGEAELTGIVDQVDEWFDQYDEFIQGDCRRGKTEISLETLREIVAQSNVIFASLGGPAQKMSKILSQAEKWNESHKEVILKCQPNYNGEAKVRLEDMKEAVEDACDNINVLQLKEANDLDQMVTRVEGWMDRAAVAAVGKRVRGKHNYIFELDDLKELVEEGKALPIDSTLQVAQVEKFLGVVVEWQEFAKTNLNTIAASFQLLGEMTSAKYGMPSEFKPRIEGAKEAEKNLKLRSEEKEGSNETQSPIVPHGELLNPASATSDLALSAEAEELIRVLSQDAKNSCVVTAEAEVAQHLDDASRWVARSLKYVENHSEIFDSRFFGAFDRFRSEGESLLKSMVVKPSSPMYEASCSWTGFLRDQLDRIKALFAERASFVAWRKVADDVVAGNDKKITIEKLRDVVQQSSRFPAENETVSIIQDLLDRCEAWIKQTSAALDNDAKMAFHEAKTILDEGNRLGVLSKELRAIKNAVKSARAWANKAKRCSSDQGQSQFDLVNSLIEEYDDLLLTLPEEFKRLNRAVKNVCICRRPFEGFMVKCVKCLDSFHGACVGISQAKAEKKPVDNFVCVRCLVEKVFDSSTGVVANVCKKWTDATDLKKARLVDYQKQQRRIRRETKEVEKHSDEVKRCNELLNARERVPAEVSSHVPPTETMGTSAEVKNSEESKEVNAVLHPPPNMDTVPTAPSDPEKDAKAEGASVDQVSSNSTNAVPAVQEMAQSGDLKVSEPGPQKNPEIEINKPKPPPSKEELLKKIEKSTAAIKVAQTKLDKFKEGAVKIKHEEEDENLKMKDLRRWCVRIRSLILSPSSEENASSSRPLRSGELTKPMQTLIRDAEIHGLTRFRDVKEVLNAFKCICWSSEAMDVLARHPKACDTAVAVRRAAGLKLPDEKGLRAMKAMSQRATAWNLKASKFLMPAPGESRGYDMKELQSLSDLASDIPLRIPMETRVAAVIDDKGGRHCLCCGPSDGRTMLCCDKCDKWFHAKCVNVSDANNIEEWACPTCRGESVVITEESVKDFHGAFSREEDDDMSVSSDASISSKAPTTERLWPPCGILGSRKSSETLGRALCSFPDDVGVWEVNRPVTSGFPGSSSASKLASNQSPSSKVIIAQNAGAAVPKYGNPGGIAINAPVAIPNQVSNHLVIAPPVNMSSLSSVSIPADTKAVPSLQNPVIQNRLISESLPYPASSTNPTFQTSTKAETTVQPIVAAAIPVANSLVGSSQQIVKPEKVEETGTLGQNENGVENQTRGPLSDADIAVAQLLAMRDVMVTSNGTS